MLSWLPTSLLAEAITDVLPGLHIKKVNRTKSLGSAIANGRTRNAAVSVKRLEAFKKRRKQFKKLRCSRGFDATATVLRTGGTAAMVYGQATMGVSNTLLLQQRRSCAATLSRGGAGDLDLTLALVIRGPFLWEPVRSLGGFRNARGKCVR